MPLYRRVPKYGFRNINRVEYRSLNIDIIQQLVANLKVEVIDVALLIEHGYISKNDKVKILGRGELTAKVDVTAHAFSASAVKAIESTGGQAIKL